MHGDGYPDGRRQCGYGSGNGQLANHDYSGGCYNRSELDPAVYCEHAGQLDGFVRSHIERRIVYRIGHAWSGLLDHRNRGQWSCLQRERDGHHRLIGGIYDIADDGDGERGGDAAVHGERERDLDGELRLD